MTGDFFDKVFRVVRLIPEGRVTTYGHIARFLGTGRSARIVGYAMNERQYENPKSFWYTARMRYIWNTTGPLSMKRFLEQPVNKGFLAGTLFLNMNWFKDEPKLTR